MQKCKKSTWFMLVLVLMSISFSGCKDKDKDKKKDAIVTYQVNFRVDGGSVVASQTIQADHLVAKVNSTKEGYVLEGWYREDTFQNKWDFDKHLVTDNINLFAKWIIIKHTMSFESNGGSNVVALELGENSLITKPTNPTKEGYVLEGWYRENTFQNKWDFYKHLVTDNINLFAKWIINKHTISFESNGGSDVVDLELEEDSLITKPANPTRAGYTFEGWYKDAELTVEWNFAEDKVERTITLYANWLTRDMVKVEGGTFATGSNGNVTLSTFYMGKYEVKQSEFESVMGFNPSSFSGGNNPVERVTWFDAVMYCNKLSEKEGLSPYYSISNVGKNSSGNITSAVVKIIGGKGYRLPTEAEWEYAARGGNKSKGYTYAGSNNIDEVAWYWSNNTTNGETSGTKAVGRKKANELGLYDMSGNVWEWCWDWWSSYTSGDKINPIGPNINPIGPNSGSSRIVRGGGWYYDVSYSRVGDRYNDDPYSRDYVIGFRIARSQ